MSATLVTCLFNLRAQEPGSARRSITDYLELARPVLETDAPMVIYTEASIEPALRAWRGTRPTFIHSVELRDYTDQSLYGLIGPVTTLWTFLEKNFPANRHTVNVDKDTPAYMALQHAKFKMVAQAAAADLFRSSAFVWIDMGIAHAVGAAALDGLADLAEHTPDDATYFGLAFPNDPPPSDEKILERFWGRLCGGLFSMPRERAIDWATHHRRALRFSLERGEYPFECDLLYSLLVRAGRVLRTEANLLSGLLATELPPTRIFQTGANYVDAFKNFPVDLATFRPAITTTT